MSRRRYTGGRAIVERLKTIPGELVHQGTWALLLMLTAHQAIVGALLFVDHHIVGESDAGIPVIADGFWSFVFLAGAVAGADIFLRRRRSRVGIAQGLMLLAYGSRALGILLALVERGLDAWTTSTGIALASWALLCGALMRAWHEARSAL